MAKFCQRCGKQLEDNARFCSACCAPVAGPVTPSFITNYAKGISTRNHWMLTFAAQFFSIIFATLPLITGNQFYGDLTLLKTLSRMDATAGLVFGILFMLAFLGSAIYMIMPIVREKPFDFKYLLPVNITAIAYYLYNVIMFIYIYAESDGDGAFTVWGWLYVIIAAAAIADLVLFSLKFKSTKS